MKKIFFACRLPKACNSKISINFYRSKRRLRINLLKSTIRKSYGLVSSCKMPKFILTLASAAVLSVLSLPAQCETDNFLQGFEMPETSSGNFLIMGESYPLSELYGSVPFAELPAGRDPASLSFWNAGTTDDINEEAQNAAKMSSTARGTVSSVDSALAAELMRRGENKSDSVSAGNYNKQKTLVCRTGAVKRHSIKLSHPWTASMAVHESGPINAQVCGRGCLDFWLGIVGDNYWSGQCAIFGEDMSFRLTSPGAIKSAAITRAVYDDYMRVYINGNLAYSGPDGRFPPETEGPCELGTSFDESLDIDVTDRIATIPEGGLLRLSTRVSVTGEGEGYAAIRILYDPAKALTDPGFSDLETALEAEQELAGIADVSWNCAAMPETRQNGCALENGVEICPEDFVHSAAYDRGISPLCKIAEAVIVPAKDDDGCAEAKADPTCGLISSVCAKYSRSGECLAYESEYACGEDYDKEMMASAINEGLESDVSCVLNRSEGMKTTTAPIAKTVTCERDGSLDGCSELSSDPACTLLSSDCLDRDKAGKCMTYADAYSCSHEIKFEEPAVFDEVVCPGNCEGGACQENVREKESSGFSEAMAALGLADEMSHDLSCSGDGTKEDIVCEVFKGTPGTCKKAFGSTVDCCESPESVGMKDYLAMAVAVKEATSRAEALTGTTLLPGAWSEAISDAADAVFSPISSVLDSAFGLNPAKAVGDLSSYAAQQFANAAAEFIGETFGAEAQSMLFTNTGGTLLADGTIEGGTFSLTPAISGLMSGIMAAYAAYAAAEIAIKLAYKCEKDEMNLAAKKEAKSCHYVGSFCSQKIAGVCVEKKEGWCCYSSPLARIAAEQINIQLGRDYGSPKNPSCPGVTLEQFKSVDWAALDLSEWTGILAENDMLTTAESAGADLGSGSAIEYAREQSVERTQSLADAMRE